MIEQIRYFIAKRIPNVHRYTKRGNKIKMPKGTKQKNLIMLALTIIFLKINFVFKERFIIFYVAQPYQYYKYLHNIFVNAFAYKTK